MTDEDPMSQRVFTPGGPRRREQVNLAAPQSLLDPEALVFTPGGPRKRRHVHRVEPGREILDRPDLSVLSPERRPLRQLRSPGPPDTSNWINSAGWTNDTGAPLRSFSSTWRVPAAPATPAVQLLYLFNGLEPADSSFILQPVLQWGDAGADDDGVNRTGPFWTIASWRVGPDDEATHTPHVRVQPGDILTGVMTLAGQTAAGFLYQCEFQGRPETALPPVAGPELTWAVHVLEAYETDNKPHQAPYDLYAQAEYPAQPSTNFDAVQIDANGPPGQWISQDYVQTFGEKMKMPINSTRSGGIVCQYR